MGEGEADRGPARRGRTERISFANELFLRLPLGIEERRAKQRESLDKALEVDPADIEVLIACYRLPEQTPEYHAKIVESDSRRRRTNLARRLAKSRTTSRPATNMPG